MFSLITELEQKYSNLKPPNNPLTIQPLNTYEYLTENNVQPSESDHFSSSTTASANSESSCSQFSTFDYDYN